MGKLFLAPLNYRSNRFFARVFNTISVPEYFGYVFELSPELFSKKHHQKVHRNKASNNVHASVKYRMGIPFVSVEFIPAISKVCHCCFL